MCLRVLHVKSHNSFFKSNYPIIFPFWYLLIFYAFFNTCTGNSNFSLNEQKDDVTYDRNKIKYWAQRKYYNIRTVFRAKLKDMFPPWRGKKFYLITYKARLKSECIAR